jgi:CheY-like chemotaxis protein
MTAADRLLLRDFIKSTTLSQRQLLIYPMSQMIPPALEQLLLAKRRRILLVDDNLDNVELLSAVLRELGQETLCISDATKALLAAEEFSPDVAVLDLDMPEFNGFQLLHAIRENAALKSLAVFALTGWADPITIKRCREFGFNRYFAKPVPMAQLCFAIAEYG